MRIRGPRLSSSIAADSDLTTTIGERALTLAQYQQVNNLNKKRKTGQPFKRPNRPNPHLPQHQSYTRPHTSGHHQHIPSHLPLSHRISQPALQPHSPHRRTPHLLWPQTSFPRAAVTGQLAKPLHCSPPVGLWPSQSGQTDRSSLSPFCVRALTPHPRPVLEVALVAGAQPSTTPKGLCHRCTDGRAAPREHQLTGLPGRVGASGCSGPRPQIQ